MIVRSNHGLSAAHACCVIHNRNTRTVEFDKFRSPPSSISGISLRLWDFGGTRCGVVAGRCITRGAFFHLLFIRTVATDRGRAQSGRTRTYRYVEGTNDEVER